MTLSKLIHLCVLGMSTLYINQAYASEKIATDLFPGWNTIDQSTLRADLSYLTSDKLEGRLALTKGDDQAIQWIARQFAQAKLKPLVGNSYLQEVKLIKYIPDTDKSYIAMERNGKKMRWKKPEVFTDFRQNIHLNSQLVFAGYGITAPDLKYDDYQNIDVRGKIVMVFEHEPQETNNASIFNGTANTIYATTRVKVLNAQKHGAIAVLIAPEPNRSHPSNQQRYARIGGSAARAVPLPAFVLANDTLHIPYAILSDDAANQIAGSHEFLAELQRAIDKDLKPQSRNIPDVKITVHDSIKSRSIGSSYNVAGLLEGTDPVLKNETIIISGHHDHDGKSGNDIYYGADDNASGTTGVVTLARAMSTNAAATNGIKLKRSILFVVFAAEERGLLGSFYMAAHPLRSLATTRAVINFDMIGRNEAATAQTDGLITIPADTTNRLNLIGTRYSPDYYHVVETENKFVNLDLDGRFNAEHALNVFFRSDQFPFVLNNIPSFWWFTGFHPDYHHITDTADKINYAKMQKILRLAYLSAYRFANDQQPPVFIKNPGLN